MFLNLRSTLRSSELRSLEIKGRTIFYVLRNSARAKRWRLTIYQGQKLVVTKPQRANVGLTEKFVLSKSAWILKHLNSQKINKEKILLDAKTYKLKQREAQLIISSRLEYFNSFYNFKYQKVTIRNQATRWGSCSRRGNLNFNVKLLDLSAPLRDYVIIHELCHLKEFNHSSRFWSLVSKTQPDYLSLRRQLKTWQFDL